MKKKVSILVLSILVLMLGVPNKASAYTNSNWMGSLDNNTSISKLSIPGTHDSGARYEPVYGTAKCQEFPISEQLNIGVRYLDIRCRHINDSFVIHHGSIYQHMNFDDVLNNCISFLDKNPTECIIMSVKEEYDASNNTESFEKTFDSYVAKTSNRWYLGSNIPTLNQARGKIVLVRRFSSNSSSKGINATRWADNATFSINNGYSQIKIQDQYKVSNNDSKWSAIEGLYNEAKLQNNNCLYINYTSGYKPMAFIPMIPKVSNDINSRVENYFNQNSKGRFGITASDFIDNDISSKIISTNF
ncbi:1-phosphatidylinositol phosphodiesterase precursor [Clostridium saccharobutylicum]|uniref:phosphatidylinositol-specific phospholipase C n=1 Tax=Clostridium saccharobutylicum TaxID=169679 RepID=UPI000983BCAE|nr:phosphatidylinositol-specific phospholipase C [Clostridium saccharobutylicum]AQS08910.1 1-phosphatidylinositol phosphodiesterase precursor [Clostridium saccharobutylicum]MBC2437699.1 phosphatidylinositol-specific phospholipase C [Clostridium saccharobutylicum]NSB90111.1 1-phosphatidylinositol phosphodiesterase [Clostridium saccharobutylicum]NYC28740.1 1-phosphatidylinositol phosphodiesterase [Clostridium saccharobutylicum]OOM17896.1 1-phosphatidylinositol phosphodiesterase precursor [Clostr